MRDQPHMITVPEEAARIARLFPSFRDFVDVALFDPTWGYYSTGQVQFGEGGHYDTFPLSLAPLFGRMLAGYAYRFWGRAGQPRHFEICEIGAGNGQLCLDTSIAVFEAARRGGTRQRFARALRYRIIERSPALIARQRQHLGPLATNVTWTRADPQRAVRGAPFGPCGLVFANEVLDCLAHHKVVRHADGGPGVVFVVPVLRGRVPAMPTGVGCVAGVKASERAVPGTQLATVLSDPRLRRHVDFREVVLPIGALPSLQAFLNRHYPEFFAPGWRFKPYFACPAIETLVRNSANVYRKQEALWIDYGDTRRFHLRAPEGKRVFAGPPHSGASVYRNPGLDDITFLVDFSVVAAAARQAGLRVKFYGGQGELARRSGVALDDRARELILRYRTLGWMLALVGVGPERAWRHTSLTWNRRAGRGGRMRDDIDKAVAEFVGERSSNFKLMIVG